jgi:hypothetical protein
LLAAHEPGIENIFTRLFAGMIPVICHMFCRCSMTPLTIHSV